MSAQSPFGLPPVSPALKPMSPYLQRAHELKSQNPIMAYWCAYHAAQLGVGLKAKDPASRDVLFALLGVLESLKKEIGPHDAIDVESVSAAYVENFALKVFVMADNEDRAGAATRSTAKKFLAAANFLEVLKVFPETEETNSTEEKIKYSKWKAADIAKAFREGRKPTPGPAGSGMQEELDATPPASPFPHTSTFAQDSTQPPDASGSGDKSIRRAPPPSHVDVSREVPGPFTPQPQTPPPQGRHLNLGGWGGEGEATPGSWSTAATPGTAQDTSVGWEDQPSPTAAALEFQKGHKPRSGSENSTPSGSRGILKKTAWVSGELEPFDANEPYNELERQHPAEIANSDDSSKKSVQFTPSITGGLSDSSIATSSAPTTSSYNLERSFDSTTDDGQWPVERYGDVSNYLPQQVPLDVDLASLPPGFIPDAHQRWNTGVAAPPPTRRTPPDALHHDPHLASPHPPPALPLHQHIYAPAAPPPAAVQTFLPLPPSEPQPTFDELTPSLIAKAQKHSRFAISALDYEDAETARRELRAALAILGG
ncbi:hypothetical protein DXG03_008491 [Asterophora parasitica]|uniref:DUF605-domain-containing protein n=1 Tax=Asterophora parasitica TaxID=117018 RepID=A0A9P7GCZ7_9AGAR|nr:hypothetical protein DXG03_008491 [Asterophora parasitica]